MIYEYRCSPCDHAFDVVKPVAEIDRIEKCPRCEKEAVRVFKPKIHISGASVEHAEWNPGLGCVVKNKYHRSELAKRKGLVEVGNDYSSGEKMQKEFDTAREEKKKKEWDDL